MRPRYLYSVLVLSALLAWWTSSEEGHVESPFQATSASASSERAAAPPVDAQADVLWTRNIRVPPAPVLAPPPPPPPPPPVPVYIPPPPPPPTAPALPVEYLGQAVIGKTRVLYVLYQGAAMTLSEGQRIGDQYLLRRITARSAVFEYLPLNQSQELHWE